MVLDQKWCFLFDSYVEIAFRLKANWNMLIFDFDCKKWIFCSQVYIWSFKRAKIFARLPIGFSNHEVWHFSFYWKNIIFEAQLVYRQENKNSRKKRIFLKKNLFRMKFENLPKKFKKLTSFFKKNWNLFSLNFTSTNRKIILKSDLKNYEFTVYIFETLKVQKA